ncbi:MAG: hypothetical protein EXS00_07585 [Phycisphaerales bacterium]|nr:hypothetical protein [Phycisphaerales bacterium]
MKLRCAHLASLACATLAQAQSVELVQFGVGSHFRPGDWTAVKLVISSGLSESITAEVTIDVPTADGDITQSSRTVVLDPGSGSALWLYPRLPPSSFARDINDDVFSVHTYQLQDGARVREIVSARVSPAQATDAAVGVELEQDLIGVVGEGRMGLDAFAAMPTGFSVIPSMNEVSIIARGLDPRDLPDRWEGLASLDSLIWGAAEPRLLSPAAAQALLDWVGMGGNLIIVLPEAGDPWGLYGSNTNPLSAVLPSGGTSVVDGVPVKDLLGVVSKHSGLLNPKATTRVHLFDVVGIGKNWRPLLSFPCPRDERTGVLAPQAETLDGSIFAIERDWGSGRIALVGIDADALQKRSLQPGGIPQADVFWDRLLARRADAPSPADYKALENSDPSRLNSSGGTISLLGSGQLVTTVIGMRGETAVGILTAMVVFALYWALAGPLGFIILRRLSLQRWSWPAFCACSLVFAAAAWAFGGADRIGAGRIQHLSVIDLVRSESAPKSAGAAPEMRATIWLSAFLPKYGTEHVSIDGGSIPPILASWSAPPGGSVEPFPDPGTYRIPVDSPADYSVPARATASMFEARWRGSATGVWSGLPAASDPTRPLIQSVSQGSSPRMLLTGVISHTLPIPLRDVTLIHIGPFRSAPRRAVPLPEGPIVPSAHLPNGGRIARLSEWPANTPLEIAASLYPTGAESPFIDAPGGLEYDLKLRYFTPFATDVWGGRIDSMLTVDRQHTFLEMLGFFDMLQPPRYLKNPPDDEENARISRLLGRSIDLSMWFTRPCLIVQGFVDLDQCPVPVKLGGVTPPSNGSTFVRVIFPLPLDDALIQP